LFYAPSGTPAYFLGFTNKEKHGQCDKEKSTDRISCFEQHKAKQEDDDEDYVPFESNPQVGFAGWDVVAVAHTHNP
jgi:hypothetical protein